MDKIVRGISNSAICRKSRLPSICHRVEAPFLWHSCNDFPLWNDFCFRNDSCCLACAFRTSASASHGSATSSHDPSSTSVQLPSTHQLPLLRLYWLLCPSISLMANHFLASGFTSFPFCHHYHLPISVPLFGTLLSL